MTTRTARRPAAPLPAAPVSGTPLVVATGVSVCRGGDRVVDGVDLAAHAGEVMALVGPNGAGKSTLLGALAGDHPLDGGTVTVHDAPLGSWRPDELAVRRGVLLQQVDVAFPFTVTEVVRMGRTPWAKTAAADFDDEVIASALAEVDLDRFDHRTYSSLSGGERARAALARVLAQEPTVLLLDEPTAALDIGHQEVAFDLVRRRAARGDAVVVVLHDLGLAAAYADTVALLDEGRLVAAGPPAAVLTADRLSRVYGHPIEVLAHPVTGAPLIVPARGAARCPAFAHPLPPADPGVRP